MIHYLISWCNENVGFITALSVTFTAVICIFNFWAIRNNIKDREQSEAQFNKNLRNQYLPYLHMDFEKSNLVNSEDKYIYLTTNADFEGNKSICYKFTIKNVGTGMMTNLEAYWINNASNIKSIVNREIKQISCPLLMKDETAEFKAIIIGDYKEKVVSSNGILQFVFIDQLENCYYQDVLVNYDIKKDGISIPSIEVKPPKPIEFYLEQEKAFNNYDDKSR